MPTRRTAEKTKQTVVWQLGDVKSPTYVVKVTKNGTTEDISSYILPPISVTWNSIREEIDSVNITLDNSSGRFVDLSTTELDPKYSGGEKIVVKFDYGSGTTKIFQGKCHALKFNRGTIRTASLFGRKLPELVDKKIKGYFNGNPKTLVKNIIDEYFSTILTYTAFETNVPDTQTIELSYDDYAFQVIRNIFIRAGWDGRFDNDDDDDGKIDLNGFLRGSKTNSNFSFVDSLNITNISDFGSDILDEYNSVQVKGSNSGGESIIFTKNDDASIASFWERDIEISDNVIDSITEAKERTEAELTLRSNLGRMGSITGVASEKILPAEKINCSAQYDGVYGLFIPVKISFTLENVAMMSVQFDRAVTDIYQLMKNRIATENGLKAGGNSNDMLYSFNLSFDDDSYSVSLGDAEITNGQLVVKNGFSSAIAIFHYPHLLPQDVTQFEVICENTEDFANITVSVSDDNSTYTEITQENQIFNGPTTDRPYLKIRLNSGTATLNGIVLRFK